MDTAYIRDIFRPEDRLAVFLKNGGRIEQHFVTAAELVTPERQAWLKDENISGTNVYVSMNALRADARTRTKGAVTDIRTIFLDIDENADTAFEYIMSDSEMPPPNYVLDTSPGKKQFVWKVEGFSPAAAEALQKKMVVKYGADPVVTDCSRVLRIPGYENRKYETPHIVTARNYSGRIHTPDVFNVPEMLRESPVFTTGKSATRASGKDSQSERDWFEVCRRLESGDNPGDVRHWLEQHRQDKPYPRYYAELTVSKAVNRTFGNTNSKQEKNNMAEEKKNEQRHYIEGNGFSVRDELKALGCRFDPEKKQWYNTSLKKAAEAQAIIEIESKAMDSAKEHETREPRHYIEGNSFAIKDKLKEMGCRYDVDEKKWYHTDPDVAKQAQALVPANLEKHQIGEAPREMTDELKGMGCKWNKETGWYHNDKEVAEKATARIKEVEPRHYLEGDGYAVKDQLKALECKWDGVQKQWYTTDLAKAAESQAVLDNAPQKEKRGKHYLTGETLEIKDQLKAMGCKWDGEKKQWYHADPDMAIDAQDLIDNHNSGTEKDKSPKPGDPAESPKHGGDTVSRVAKEIDRGL